MHRFRRERLVFLARRRRRAKLAIVAVAIFAFGTLCLVPGLMAHA